MQVFLVHLVQDRKERNGEMLSFLIKAFLFGDLITFFNVVIIFTIITS